MATTRRMAGLLCLFATTTGCATLRAHQTACRWTSGIVGGVVGAGAGAAVGSAVSDNDASIAGGAAGGLVVGAIAGGVAGHFLCEPPAEPAPPPPPPPAPAPPPGTKIETLAGPYFAFNRAELTPEGRTRLEAVVTVLGRHPTVRVLVEGHTDAIGSDAYNLRLSERRAAAVRDYLVEHGVEATRIDVRGAGKAAPIASNATEAGRAQNRRVEITVE